MSGAQTGGRLTAADAAAAVLDSMSGGETVIEVLLLEAPGLKAAARLLVWERRTSGTLGDPKLDASAIVAARGMLAAVEPATLEVHFDAGVAKLYLEPHRPADDLVIVGAGHIARPLCRVGAMLGFRVLVLDDRPEFATRERFPEAAEVLSARFPDPFEHVSIGARSHLVLVTRGHKYDYDALRDVLRREAQPAYIGMVGSRRRVRAAFEQLAREGIPRDRLAEVHAPIGLDVGAETPEEIAVAIAAELVRCRRGGSGRPLREVERVVERWMASSKET